MFHFNKIFKQRIEQKHLELCKELVDLYGDILLPEKHPELSTFQYAMNYGSLCIPGWYAVEVDGEPIGVVSAVLHNGIIQVDVAFLPKAHKQPVIKESFKEWCAIVRDMSTEPMIVNLDKKSSQRFFEKCGWIYTDTPNQMIFKGE